MRFLAYLLVCLTAAGCVLEDRPITSDGGADGGPFCVDCEGDTPVCNESTGLCVQCTPEEAGECGDDTPVCNESAGLCVQCTPEEAGECGDDTPVCNESTGLCVQCTPEETGECGGDTPLCDPGLSECVACLADGDCNDPTEAKCDDMLKECVPCDDRAQCDDVDGFPGTANACNADGECVECTPASETETCANDVSCDPATETCTTTTRGSREVCQTCIADSECGDEGVPSQDFRCVPMFYPNDQTRFPDGSTGFCLEIFEPGGCTQPYAITISDRSSLSDPTPRSYCGINEDLTTCSAVRALVMNDDCLEDADCPTGGICRDVGGLSDKCTYLCESLVECLPDNPPGRPGSTCGSSGGGGDDFCGG